MNMEVGNSGIEWYFVPYLPNDPSRVLVVSLRNMAYQFFEVFGMLLIGPLEYRGMI